MMLTVCCAIIAPQAQARNGRQVLISSCAAAARTSLLLLRCCPVSFVLGSLSVPASLRLVIGLLSSPKRTTTSNRTAMTARSVDTSFLGETVEHSVDPSSSPTEAHPLMVKIGSTTKKSRKGDGQKAKEGEDSETGNVGATLGLSSSMSSVSRASDEEGSPKPKTARPVSDSAPITPKLKSMRKAPSSEKMLLSSKKSKAGKGGSGMMDELTEDLCDVTLSGSAPNPVQMRQRKEKNHNKRATMDGDCRTPTTMHLPVSVGDVSGSESTLTSESSSSSLTPASAGSPGPSRRKTKSGSLNTSTPVASGRPSKEASSVPSSINPPTSEAVVTGTSPTNGDGLVRCGSPVTDRHATGSRQSTANLLNDILRSPKHLALLRAHMQEELCDENLDFWIDVQHLSYSFQFQALQAGRPLDPKEVFEQASVVFKTYIDTSAPRSLNLPSKVGGRIRHCFRNTPDALTTSIFAEAQQSTFKVMECDPFPRFIKKSRTEALDGLTQLSALSSSTECDEFLKILDEEMAKKWSKVVKGDGVKVSKRDASGIHHIRAEAEIDAPASDVFNFIQAWQNWSQWQRSSVMTMELERVSDNMQLVYYFWPIAHLNISKNSELTDRDWVLLIANKSDPNAYVVTYRSIPHATAPTPPNSTRGTALPCGWRVVPSPNNPSKCFVTCSARAEKPETKKWDKEALAQHQAMLNLRAAFQDGKRASTTSTSSD